jgi:peptide/nickel transport system ATP-binding protein
VRTVSTPLLELKNITKVFRIGGGLGLISKRTIKAVDSVSFSMPSDKPLITALVGESGSGKTTIARIILGLLEPTSGEVFYKGRRVSEWLKKSRMEYFKEVQPIFQDPYSIYNPFYRIDRVLELVIKKFKLAASREEARELMVKAMNDIGLRPEDLLGRYPHQLSGGERQRLMLARILLLKPRLIVADEPVSMIDVSLRAIFLDQLMSFRDKFGASCLYITHDLNTASYVADNILVLCHGRMVEEGPKDVIVNDPLHPYTKLLVSSIPIPNPRQRWKESVDLTSIESFKKLKVEEGCVFSARCPHAKDVCRAKVPPPLEVEPGRKVACFLFYK